MTPSVHAAYSARLINAYRSAPNSVENAMLPHRSYFLEFPVEDASFSAPRLAPLCSNRSPFSFLFRRGGSKNFRKLIVEFEGGPACWESNCGCDKHARGPPWKDYSENHETNPKTARRISPQLGTCSGFVSEFLEELSPHLFGNNTSQDIPLSLRISSDMRSRNTTDPTWWQALSPDIHDWSYLLVPHCSMDWYLGYGAQGRWSGCELEGPDPPFDGAWWDAPVYQGRERIWHRGTANLEAVLDWLVNQYPEGLEAMISVSGGKIGGCLTNNDPEYTSTVAPMILAKEAAEAFEWKEPSSILAILEGSSLSRQNLPSKEQLDEYWNSKLLSKSVAQHPNLLLHLKQMILEAPEVIDVAWMTTSSSSSASSVESVLLADLQAAKPENFFTYMPPATASAQDLTVSKSACPQFAFPDVDNLEAAPFFENLAKGKSWASSSDATRSNDVGIVQANGPSVATVKRLGYMSILVLFLGILSLVWMIYFLLKFCRQQQGQPAPLSPGELWMKALTHYPVSFLLISVLLPLVLSLLGLARSDYKINVNLDFESYLDISSELDVVAKNYAAAQQFQEESASNARIQCRAMGGGVDSHRRRQLNADAENYPHLWDGSHRALQESGASNNRDRWSYVTVYMIYQNRNGGNVFTPNVLSSIYHFEEHIRSLPDFETYCRRDKEKCSQFDSPLTYLYQNETLVEDIEATLVEKVKSSHVDQFFNAENLQSNITKSIMYFQGPQSEIHRFLDHLYNFLWKRDQEKYYQDMVYTWENEYLLRLEANDALYHDTRWSAGSLVVIGAIMLLKVQDLFIFFFGMTGLLLAFTTSYYWCTMHFGIPDVTLLHVSGLFVMLGIGADDIFLMTDSYTHAEPGGDDLDLPGADISTDEEHETIRRKMYWAYSTAGSMMLVSSMTAAVCFFSNSFGVLLVIQEFGVYMGTVVLINYFHVMTILPSAMLVNEMYIKPWKRRVLIFCELREGETTTGSTGGNGGMKLVKTGRASQGPSAKAVVSGQDNILATNDAVEMRLESSSVNDNCTGAFTTPNSSRLNRVDRMLLDQYTPFLTKQSNWILALSIFFAGLLGLLGFLNLEFTDGSIVIFSSNYNQGRLALIQDKYYTVSSNDRQVGSTSDGDGAGDGGSCIGLDCNSDGGGGGEGSQGGNGGDNGNGNGNGVGNGVGNGGGGGGNGGGSGGGNGGSGGEGSGGGGGGSGNLGNSAGNAGNFTGGAGGSGEVSTITPTTSPTIKPSAAIEATNNVDAIKNTGKTIEVKLIWGVGGGSGWSNERWTVEVQSDDTPAEQQSDAKLLDGLVSGFDVSEPESQQWLLDVAEAARSEGSLDVIENEITWIELFADFLSNKEGGFPVPKELFTSYVEVLESTNPQFSRLVYGEIGTKLPGLAGSSLYASITFRTYDSATLTTFDKWDQFAHKLNAEAPNPTMQMVAQSDLFWNEARATETVDATVMTWLIANLICCAIILLFTQNILLSLMVVVAILLMFLCITGLLFAILQLPLGPVQALGVSIFIGLSANYSLHIVHAYHRSHSIIRETKVKEAIFITGSPIFASALSTVGGCVFLFGCRALPLVELGILICCVTAMALVFSLGFLLAWLLTVGPIPVETVHTAGYQPHRWDLCAIGRRQILTRAKNDIADQVESKEDKNANMGGVDDLNDLESMHSLDSHPTTHETMEKAAEVSKFSDSGSQLSGL